MNVLHITCSPRAADSFSSRFSLAIVERLAGSAGPIRVALRDLTDAAALPHTDGPYAVALAGGGPADAHGGSLDRSDELIAELDRADAVVIGSPMHNYTVPSSLKAWIDHVVRIGRTFAPGPDGKKLGLLRDRPVYVAVASGGFYAGERSRQPDFFTPYLKAALGTIGLHTLHFFPLEGMAMGEARVAAGWAEATAMLDAVLPLAADVDAAGGVLVSNA